jgi:hypothetical protein
MAEQPFEQYASVDEFLKKFFPNAPKSGTESRPEQRPESFGETLAVNSLHKFATQLRITR